MAISLGGVTFTISGVVDQKTQRSVGQLAESLSKLDAVASGATAKALERFTAAFGRIASPVESASGSLVDMTRSAQGTSAAVEACTQNVESLSSTSKQAAKASDLLAKSTKAAEEAIRDHTAAVTSANGQAQAAIEAKQKMVAAVTQEQKSVAGDASQWQTMLGTYKQFTDQMQAAHKASLAAQGYLTTGAPGKSLSAGMFLGASHPTDVGFSYRAAVRVQQDLAAAYLGASQAADRYLTSANLATASTGILSKMWSGFVGNMKEGVSQLASVTDKMGGLHSAMIMVVSALGGMKMYEFIKDATLYAGRVQVLKTVMYQVGANAHYSKSEMDVLEASTKKLGITTEAAREGITLLARNELDLTKNLQLARIAQDSAVISGMNSSEAYEKIALSVQRLDTRMLRNQGIMVNLRNEYQRVALATGRVETTLTAQEKQQILLNAVIRAGVNTFGVYEAAMNDAYKQYTSLQRYQDEALKEFGSQFQGIFSSVVTAATNALKWFAEADSGIKAVAASAAGATAALLGVAAAVQAVAFSLSALKFAAGVLGGPLTVGLTVLGVALSGIAAGYTYLSAQAENARIETKKQATETSEAALKLMELKKVADSIEVYGDLAELSAYQLEDMNAQMDKAIFLMADYADKLDAVKDNAKKFAETMKTIRPEIRSLADQLMEESQTRYTQAFNEAVEVYMNVYQVSMKDAQQKVKEIIEGQSQGPYLPEYSKFTPSTGGPVVPYMGPGTARESTKEEQERMKRSVDIARKESTTKETYREFSQTQELRRLDELAKAQEVANQLALRISDNLHRERVKQAKSSALEIQDTMDEYLQSLSNAQMTEAQILRKATLTWEVESKQRAEAAKKDRLKEGVSVMNYWGQEVPAFRMQEEYDESKQKERQSMLDLERQIQDTAIKSFEEQMNIARAFDATMKITESSIEKDKKEIAQIEEEIQLAQAGMDTKLAKINSEITETISGRRVAVEEFNKKMFGDADARVVQETRDTIELIKKKLELKLYTEEEAKTASLILPILERRIQLEEKGYEGRAQYLRGEIAYHSAALERNKDNIEALEKKQQAERELARVEYQMAKEKETMDLDERKRVDVLIQQRDEYKLAIEESHDKLIDQERKLTEEQRKLADERKKMLGEEIVTLEEVRRKIEKIDDERKKANEDVRDFLEDQRAATVDKVMPGFQKVYKEYEKFSDMLAKATDKKDVDALAQAFQGTLLGAISESDEELRKLYVDMMEARQDYARSQMTAYSKHAGGKDITNTMYTVQDRYQKMVEATKKFQEVYQRRTNIVTLGNEARVLLERKSQEANQRILDQQKERDGLAKKEKELKKEALDRNAEEAKQIDRELQKIKDQIVEEAKHNNKVKERLGLYDQLIAAMERMQGLQKKIRGGEIVQTNAVNQQLQALQTQISSIAEKLGVSVQTQSQKSQEQQDAKPEVMKSTSRAETAVLPTTMKSAARAETAVSPAKVVNGSQGGAAAMDIPTQIMMEARIPDNVPPAPAPVKPIVTGPGVMWEGGRWADSTTGKAVDAETARTRLSEYRQSQSVAIKERVEGRSQSAAAARQRRLEETKAKVAADAIAYRERQRRVVQEAADRSAAGRERMARAQEMLGWSPEQQRAWARQRTIQEVNAGRKPTERDKEQARLESLRQTRRQDQALIRKGWYTEDAMGNRVVDRAAAAKGREAGYATKFLADQAKRRQTELANQRELAEAFARGGRPEVERVRQQQEVRKQTMLSPFSGGMGNQMVDGVIGRLGQTTQSMGDLGKGLQGAMDAIGGAVDQLTQAVQQVTVITSDQEKRFKSNSQQAQQAVRGIK